MSYVDHNCVIGCCLCFCAPVLFEDSSFYCVHLLIYIRVLFMFWFTIVIILKFKADFCFGFKVGYVDVFGCCFGCLSHVYLHCVIGGSAFNQGVMFCCVFVVFMI